MAGRIDPKDTAPVPWRDFVTTFQLASRRIGDLGAAPAGTPPAGAGREYTKPLEIVTGAIAELFGPDYEHASGLAYRFFALIELITRGDLDAWLVREAHDADEFGIHPALLLAAADVKLTRTGRFPLRRLLARTAAIQRTEGEDGC